VSTGAADRPASPYGAKVWGLGRVAALEHPRLWRGLLDLPGTVDERTQDRVCGGLAGPGPGDQLAIRAGGVFARRLVPQPIDPGAAAPGWTLQGTVLVTDAATPSGLAVSRWFAESGAAHLVLLTGATGEASWPTRGKGSGRGQRTAGTGVP